MADERNQPAPKVEEERGYARDNIAPLWSELARPKYYFWLVVGLSAALAIALRVVALDSDAYARLSWSSALLTDEGFYIHNARNVILFGHSRTDDFNNMLIMPTLHAIQVVWFRLFGVGAIQARLISVFACLLTLPLFFGALRRTLGIRVALVGTLFLGLDHINLLYSRLALMDTPAAALLICGLYTFVRGMPSSKSYGEQVSDTEPIRQQNVLAWLFGCGIILGATYATRGLTALFIPCFFVALWVGASDEPLPHRRNCLVALSCGLAVSIVAFLILWYLPHEAEIRRVNRYYIFELLVPRSLTQLAGNILRALFHYDRGTMPYLLRHSPVQFFLTCTGIGWAIVTRLGRRTQVGTGAAVSLGRPARTMIGLLTTWTIVALGFLCCVNYAPSRYNVLFYPAIAALSAFTLFEAPRVVGEILERKGLLASLASFMMCLTGQALRSRLVLIDVASMHILFWTMTLALYLGSKLTKTRPQSERDRYAEGRQPPEIWVTGVLVWAIVNGYWSADWLRNLTYRQLAADRWLEKSLPTNSTLIGAVAPGLCMNNRLKAVNVIAGLCNDGPVIEQSDPPRYILILDGADWREKWWDKSYPNLVRRERQIHSFHNVMRPFFVISVYSVDPLVKETAAAPALQH